MSTQEIINNQPVGKKANASESNFVKILIIGFLAILLYIPTLFVSNLISERAARYEEAGKEIASKWGGSQLIHGAMLAIPYRKSASQSGDSSEKKYLYILPESLNYNVNVNPTTKSRGMYETVVYDANATMDGNFNLNLSQINTRELDLSKAILFVGVSDMKGLSGEADVKLNGQKFQMSRTTGGPILAQKNEDKQNGESDFEKYAAFPSRTQANDNGLYTVIDLTKNSLSNFSINLPIKGSREIYLVPTAKDTSATITSPWTHPSFDGAYLPDASDSDKDSNNGFIASWKVSEFNSSKPTTFTQSHDSQVELENLADQAFGVKFRQDVDFYQKSERVVKYALLFIVLTFVTFFCFEILGSKKKIHPVQYIFVGLALVLFYVLLIAFAEYIGFGLAYLLGAVMITGLVTWYASYILKSKQLTLAVGGLLGFIYTYLYVLMQMEDKTLLVGAVSLFLALAVVMFVTRNVDWYGEVSQK